MRTSLPITWFCIAFAATSIATAQPTSNIEFGASPLHWAAAENDVAEMRRLIASGVSVDDRGERGLSTPLHLAARDGRIDAVRLLVELGADVNARTAYGNTPLHYAAGSRTLACLPRSRGGGGQTLTEGHRAVIELLLDAGALPDPRNVEGVTPLQKAATCNDVEVARRLIELGANINNRAHQYSVLDTALAWGDDVAELLLTQEGIEVNTYTPYSGETPLHKTRSPRLVQLLLAAGANPHARHRQFRGTPFEGAGCNAALVRIYLQHSVSTRSPYLGREVAEIRSRCPLSLDQIGLETPLHRAAEAGDTDTMQEILDRESEVDERDLLGQTPLHVAARAAQFEAVQLLVESGADVNARTAHGETPLAMARGRDVRRFLSDHGAEK